MTLVRTVLSASLLLFAGLAGAQEWPTKPIRFLNPNAAGGVGEVISRFVAPHLEAKLGQRIIVESKPGAGGAIGAAEIARSAPDGYNLLIAPTNVYVVIPHITKNVSYDPINGLEPISLMTDAEILIVVNSKLPVKNLKELATHVRANPGRLNVGSPGAGSPAHILGEYFGKLHGGMVHVAYKGAQPVALALQTNEIQVLFATVALINAQLKGGSVRAVASLTRERMSDFPDVPTVIESGMPELGTSGNWWGLAAPKGTDARIVQRLSSEIRAALADPAVKKRLADLGMVTIGSTPSEFGQFIRTESARWKRAVDLVGIKPE